MKAQRKIFPGNYDEPKMGFYSDVECKPTNAVTIEPKRKKNIFRRSWDYIKDLNLDCQARRSSNLSNTSIDVTSGFRSFAVALSTYSTVRLTKIQNFKIAFLFRIMQLSIFGYIIGYNVIYKKGYQIHDNALSVIFTKVKGVGIVNLTGPHFDFHNEKDLQQEKILAFDGVDMTRPSLERNAVFITTNFIETRQQQGICAKDNREESLPCKKDSECSTDMYNSLMEGYPTGSCYFHDKNKTRGNCALYGWCPLEDDSEKSMHMISNVKKTTLFIRNSIMFKKFNKTERNIDYENMKWTTYNEEDNPFCPIFSVDYILNKSESNATERENMLKYGSNLRLSIIWECEYGIFEKVCVPRYEFERFDKGFNYRDKDMFHQNGVLTRHLWKLFGLRIRIDVRGTAGKFSAFPLALTLGSAIGLMSLCTIIMDVILLNCTKKRHLYRELKEYNGVQKYKHMASPGHMGTSTICLTSFKQKSENKY